MRSNPASVRAVAVLIGLIEMAAVSFPPKPDEWLRRARSIRPGSKIRNASHPQLYVAHFNFWALALAGQLLGPGRGRHVAQRVRNRAQSGFRAGLYQSWPGLRLSRRHRDAIELWRLAVSRTVPVNASAVQYVTTALTQIARVLAAQHSEEAEDAIRQCLEINPHQPDIIEQYTALRLASANGRSPPLERIARNASTASIRCRWRPIPTIRCCSWRPPTIMSSARPDARPKDFRRPPPRRHRSGRPAPARRLYFLRPARSRHRLSDGRAVRTA